MLWTYRVILTLAVVLSIKAVENATHPALPYIPSSESNSTHQYPASISHSPPGSPMPTPQPTPTLTHDATKPIQKKVRYKWCPDVLCPILTSKGQDLCLQKWLFILATGRSGSTSILESFNYINSIFRLRGEFGGSLGDLMKFQHNEFVNNPSHKQEIAANHHHYFDLKNLYYHYQQIVIDLDPPGKKEKHRQKFEHDKILGFKEIRLNTQTHLQFLKKVFPCSRIIYNFRENVQEQKKSAFFKEKNTKSENDLKELNRQIEHLSKIYPATTTLMQLETFGPDTFNQVLEWMNIKSCKFKKVCHSNIDNSYQKCGQSKNDTVEGRCHDGFDHHELLPPQNETYHRYDKGDQKPHLV